jgi:hypothetical protein
VARVAWHFSFKKGRWNQLKNLHELGIMNGMRLMDDYLFRIEGGSHDGEIIRVEDDTCVSITTLEHHGQQLRVCAFGDNHNEVQRARMREVEMASLWLTRGAP